ncbi:MAG: fatty acid desaturase family protein [Rubricella sp.]
MSRNENPDRLNLVLTIGVVLAGLGLFVILPLLVVQSPWWGILVLPAVLTTPTLWALIHEAIHGRLHRDRAVNDALGRVLSILFGCPFQLLRLGHLQHHRFNRTPLNAGEVVFGGRPGPADRLRHHALLLGGFYLAEVLASVLSLLPRSLYERVVRFGFGRTDAEGRTMWSAAQVQLLRRKGRRRMRMDGAAVVLLWIASFLLYGGFWWMVALGLALRAVIVSSFDNAYHYANPLGVTEAGHNLSLPRWAEAWILNYNYHAVHHGRPHVPWTELPAEFARSGYTFGDRFLAAWARQLEGAHGESWFTEDHVRSDHLGQATERERSFNPETSS